MKVLLLSNMYPKNEEVFGNFVAQQVERLSKQGVEFLKVVRRSKTLTSYLPFFFRALFYLIGRKYHLIHAHYGFHSAITTLVYKKAPLIITCHGSDVLIEPYRNIVYCWLQFITLKKATHLIAVSNHLKKILISQLKIKRKRISVISCGVDTNLFKPLEEKGKIKEKLNLPKDKKIILFVGGVSYNKGVDVVVECAKRMKKVLFVLIGKQKTEGGEFLKKIPPNCYVVGEVPHKTMPLWLNVSEIFLLPSRTEGIPVSLLEALACGIPAITSRVGGIPEVMEEGKTGWMIPIEEIEVIVHKIEDLLQDEKKRYYMGQYGRTHILKNFDQKIITQKIYNLYHKLAP